MQLQPSLSDCGELWGPAMRVAAHRRSSHEDVRPATVAGVQLAASPTSQAEEAGEVAVLGTSLAKGPRPSRYASL